MVRTIFDACRPRPDVLAGTVESDFAADLARVVRGEASAEYADPVRFFANTYPTAGLRDLLANVCRRLSGAGGEAAAIFRLDTSYGGGKTHGLIALAHAATGLAGVPNARRVRRVIAVACRQCTVGSVRRRECRSDEWSGDGHGRRRGARLHAVGRVGIRARRQRGLWAGAQERRATHRAGFGDAAGAVRRRADADSAGRALGLPAQGEGPRRRRRPAHGVSDVAVQGRGECTERRAGLHARDRTGRSRRGRLLGRKPVHRRSGGGSRERVRAQGDTPEPNERRRVPARSASPPVRGNRRRRTGVGGFGVPGALALARGWSRSASGPAGDGRAVPRQLPVPSGSPRHAHGKGVHPVELPARPGGCCGSWDGRCRTFGARGRATPTRSICTTSIREWTGFGRKS